MARSDGSLRGCLVSRSTCEGAIPTNAWQTLVRSLDCFWRTLYLPLTLSERAKSCLCVHFSSCQIGPEGAWHTFTSRRMFAAYVYGCGGVAWGRRGLMQPVCESAGRNHVLRSVGLKVFTTSKERWKERLRVELEGPARRDAASVSAVTAWQRQGSRIPNTVIPENHRSQTTCATSLFGLGRVPYGEVRVA